MTLPIAVLAGGLATRMRPLTETIPKSLLEVAGRPFAEHQIRLLADHGIRDIYFLVGHLGDMLRDALGNGDRWGVRLQYVFDGPQSLGTGGAIAAAADQLGESFFVLYGDSYLECDYLAVEQAFVASGRGGLMTVCRNDDLWDRSNVIFERGRIVRYDKQEQTAAMHHIDYGLGVLHRHVFARYPPGTALDLSAVYQDLLAGDDLAGYDVPGRFYEIGSPAGLTETRAYLASKGAATG